MELNDFSTWLNTTYDFDCNDNELFKTSLSDAFEQFKKSTVNGIPFPVLHQGTNLFPEFLQRFLRHLTGLLEFVPEPGLNKKANVLGLNLNQFSSQKQMLKSQLSELKTQCGYE